MAHWREDYLAALAVRDKSEKANLALYDAYTRLADRTATLASPTGADSNTVADQESSMHIQAQQSSSIPPAKNQTTEAGNPKELLTAARADLAEAQRSRSELQKQVNRITTELENTRKKNQYDAHRLKSVESERIQLYSRLKDRDEELSAKGKLLEEFQDEMMTLNLQLNMADEKSNRLELENQGLIDRWMARMGEEADAMNKASNFS